VLESNGKIKEFLKQFCAKRGSRRRGREREGDRKGSDEEGMAAFCESAALECVVQEKVSVLPTYLAIKSLIDSLPTQRDASGLWNLRLALDFYRETSGNTKASSGSGSVKRTLIGLDFLGEVETRVNAFFDAPEFLEALAHHIAPNSNTNIRPEDNCNSNNSVDSVLFGCFLGFYEFPSSSVLQAGMERLRKLAAAVLRGSTKREAMVMPLVSMVWPEFPIAAKLKLARCLASTGAL